VKVAALWVEDATSAYQETMKRGARSFMEPTVEKMNLAKWFVRDLYLRRNRSCFVERKIGCFLARL
jgi:4-hydroxyphenylpyruvate dioxygenase